MKRIWFHWILIAIVGLSLFLPAAGAQSDTSKKSTGANAPPPLPPPPTYSLTEAPAGYSVKQLEFFELYCFTEVNKQREAQALAPLLFLDTLRPAARSYSRQLAEENFFSHTDPVGRSVSDRLRSTGIKWTAIGENLSRASGYLDPIPDVVASWMRNPLHRTNILNPEYRYAAMGVWIKGDTFFFTEVFINK